VSKGRRGSKWAATAAIAAASVLATFLVFSVLQVLWVRCFDPPGTFTMVQRVVEHARSGEGLAWPDRRVRSMSELGGAAPRAVLAAEDARFYLHGGFDWENVCDAVGDRRRTRMRGASTITQQTAKNLFLWQGRSWVRKGLEVWYTLLLETLVPKHRILELYLNVAETGPMVFGVEAGAVHHFGRPAKALTSDQAGRLAGIFPDPRRRSVHGSAAAERARFVRSNPAPVPGDRAWDLVVREWESERRGPLRCLGW
jgi:monofunctional biosynthetic peptidoglycan transglycosylase